MKIALIVGNIEQLPNWKIRIIYGIMQDANFDLSFVFNAKKEVDTITGFRFQKNSLGTLLLQLQKLVERKLFFREVKIQETENSIAYLKQISSLKINIKIKNQYDIEPEHSNFIKSLELDLLLNLESNETSGSIINYSKYGVWTLRYVDAKMQRVGPIGFWEILFKEPSVGVSLQRHTIHPEESYIIDKANFNRHWSVVKTEAMVLEATVSLVLKNLRKLSLEKSIPTLYKYDSFTYKAPNLYFSAKYIYSFYFYLSNRLFKNCLTYFKGIRYDCWTLFIGEGNFLEAKPTDMKPVELPKNEFWADPFFFTYLDTKYVFFENYSYKTKRGKISCGILKDEKVINVVDVLVLDYHLSFPFIFEEDGSIYLMPETSENKRLEIYRCTDFPTVWELFSTAFEGEAVADTVLFNDTQNQKWLFMNKRIVPSTSMENELYIYKIDSLKLTDIQPHSQNPVIIDCRSARNAGPIFEHKGRLFRPSQRNVDGIYGRALNINKIEKLTLDDYIEKSVGIFKPDFNNDLVGMHHLHQFDGNFVIDAAYGKK